MAYVKHQVVNELSGPIFEPILEIFHASTTLQTIMKGGVKKIVDTAVHGFNLVKLYKYLFYRVGHNTINVVLLWRVNK